LRHQPFVFGAAELAGLKIFFTVAAGGVPSPTELAQGKIGSCIACHAAPHFTDFGFHNIGVAQKEYDDIHGTGTFVALFVPSLAQRDAAPENYLPATHEHPTYQEPFRAIPLAGRPELTDLGLWNVFRNPDMPAPQQKLSAILCGNQQPCPLTDDQLLDRALAQFKTAGLRDLGHSGPYMHNGRFNSLETTIEFYIFASTTMRLGALRNGDSGLNGIALIPADVPPLAAFLRSLNEDHQKDQRPDGAVTP
jgi:cytochrome c peroxidase